MTLSYSDLTDGRLLALSDPTYSNIPWWLFFALRTYYFSVNAYSTFKEDDRISYYLEIPKSSSYISSTDHDLVSLFGLFDGVDMLTRTRISFVTRPMPSSPFREAFGTLLLLSYRSQRSLSQTPFLSHFDDSAPSAD